MNFFVEDDELHENWIKSLRVAEPKPVRDVVLQKHGLAPIPLSRSLNGPFGISACVQPVVESVGFVTGPKEKARIQVFRAEELGLYSWYWHDVFGSKGSEYVRQFGLEHCLMDDPLCPCRTMDRDDLRCTYFVSTPIQGRTFWIGPRVGNWYTLDTYTVHPTDQCRFSLLALRAAGRR